MESWPGNETIALCTSQLCCVCVGGCFPYRKKLGQFAAFLGVLVIFLALVKPILNAFILMSVSIMATMLLCVEMKA